MWRTIALVVTLAVLPAVGSCDNLQFTVDASDVGTLLQGPGSIDLYSSGLNGTVLSGQSLALNLQLSNQMLSRLYLIDPAAFGVELVIDTNAGTSPGFAGPTTGYLLGPNGNAFGDPQTAGEADGCCPGELDLGLVSFTSANLDGAEILDISGAHFDTSLPNNGYTITNTQLVLNLNSGYDAVEFGTAQQLPEPPTVWLVLAGALGFAAFFGANDGESERLLPRSRQC
jgi:hypothetical protein